MPLIAILLSSAISYATSNNFTSVYSCNTKTNPDVDITLIQNHDSSGVMTSQLVVLKTDTESIKISELTETKENTPDDHEIYKVTWTAYEFELMAYFYKSTPTMSFTADLTWLGKSYKGMSCNIL